MRAPRWTLAAAATALVLPVAGPAFATAAVDAETTFLAAMSASLSGADDCEDEAEEAPASQEPGDQDALVEAADTDDGDAVEDEANDGGEDDASEGDAAEDDDTDPCPGDGDEPSPTPEDQPDELVEEDEDSLTGEDDSDDEPTDDETDPDATEAEQRSHGALVSSVARCAPRGAEARELGLNHGAFVSAAARGQQLDVDGRTFDLSSPEGAAALCEFVADSSTPDRDGEVEEPTDVEPQSAPQQDSRGNRPESPGQSKDKAGPPSDRGNGPPAEAGPKENPGNKGGNGKGNGGGPPAHAGNGNGGGPKR